MPASDHMTIPKVLSLVSALKPLSILDVGAGNGKYGFLFRESLDWNWGRLSPDTWQTTIDAIEIDKTYLTSIHYYIYDTVVQCDWLYYETERQYDMIFMGDVLEHWPDGLWQDALKKAKNPVRYYN